MTCPFGQCEHTPNAHSKTRCLICDDCEKAPRVVLPDPPAAPQEDPEFDVEILHPCGVCHALTADREAHVGWHERQLNTLENLARSVAAIAAQMGVRLPAPSTPNLLED